MAIYKWVGDSVTATIGNIGANNSGIKNRAFRAGKALGTGLSTSYTVASANSATFTISNAVTTGTNIYASVFFNSGSTYSYSTASDTICSYSPSTGFSNQGSLGSCYNDTANKTVTVKAAPSNGSRSSSTTADVTFSYSTGSVSGKTNTNKTINLGDISSKSASGGSGTITITATLASGDYASSPGAADNVIAKTAISSTVGTVTILGAVKAITVGKSSVVIAYNETLNVSYTLQSYYDGSANYIYSKIVATSVTGASTYVSASASGGNVTIKGTSASPGADQSATITLTSNCSSRSAITKTISVTVKSFKMNPITLNPGDKTTVTLPSGLTSGKTVSLTSSNTGVGTVSGSTITAVAVGTSTISVLYNGVTMDSFTLTVKALSVTIK